MILERIRFDAVATPLETMVAITEATPLYRERKLPTLDYIDQLFVPAVRLGQVVFMGISQVPHAFFTHYRPETMPRPGVPPTLAEWMGHGLYLWIGDLCCAEGVTATALGRGVASALVKGRLVRPGEKALYWRSNGRAGWIAARDTMNGRAFRQR